MVKTEARVKNLKRNVTDMGQTTGQTSHQEYHGDRVLGIHCLDERGNAGSGESAPHLDLVAL